MDLYVLDGLLRRSEMIDVYKSLIWTERENVYGDFELVVHDTKQIRDKLPINSKVVILNSQRVMIVENIEGEEDNEGNDILTFSGRSLESILADRAAMPAMASLTVRSKWELTGTPQQIIQEIFEKICVTGVLDPRDALPFYHAGRLNPLGDIPMPTEVITRSLDPKDAYDEITNLCQIYNLGFRIVRNNDLSELYFEVYTGNDCTSGQTDNPAVIFSKALDTLTGTREVSSSADYKNVAYVFAKNGSMKVYADGVDENVSGFDRRVLAVKADDIDLPAGSALNAAMLQRGKEELSKYRMILAFDGEIPKVSVYTYGKDYGLGDLTEIRDNLGKTNNMYVTEQIFISDAEGVRSYPTLSFDQMITEGTWFSWPPNQEWGDLPSTYPGNDWADLE